LLPRRILHNLKHYQKQPALAGFASIKKGSMFDVLPFELEREKSLELSTSTLARLRSTN
jgi:hypothetical protein